jgi:hypothetical protein
MSYLLIDKENNTYTLPENIVLREDDKFKMDNKLIDRSFRDGSVFPGLTRMDARKIIFSLPQWSATDAIFRNLANTILMWCIKTVKIRDTVRNIETDILFDSGSLKYDIGSFLRSSDNSLEFTQLFPYWEDVNYSEQNISGSSPSTTGTLNIPNLGYAEMPLLITVTNPLSQIDEIILLIIENNQGFTLEDPVFGNNITDELIINTKYGEVTLNGIKRDKYIIDNTGFITIPIGGGTLNYDINGDCDIKIQYKARCFL